MVGKAKASGTSVPSSDKTRAKRRTSRVYVRTACDRCRKSKRGCNGEHPCQVCVRAGGTCTYSEMANPSSETGARSVLVAKNSVHNSADQDTQQLTAENGSTSDPNFVGHTSVELRQAAFRPSGASDRHTNFRRGFEFFEGHSPQFSSHVNHRDSSCQHEFLSQSQQRFQAPKFELHADNGFPHSNSRQADAGRPFDYEQLQEIFPDSQFGAYGARWRNSESFDQQANSRALATATTGQDVWNSAGSSASFFDSELPIGDLPAGDHIKGNIHFEEPAPLPALDDCIGIGLENTHLPPRFDF